VWRSIVPTIIFTNPYGYFITKTAYFSMVKKAKNMDFYAKNENKIEGRNSGFNVHESGRKKN
jgi:hypothetical protein